MKRPPPPNSHSSSSCINSPKTQKISKPKRVRAKKIQNAAADSVVSTKSRSSPFRGVTRHRWTGRFEAHLWDKSVWNSIQNKKGKQIYLGAYDNEESAARTYDLAALKYWGPDTPLNFPLEMYSTEIEEMQKLTKEEYLASLRRKSSGFSRGVSKYRGVARHHHNGRWEARIGRVSGNKYLYLGTYSTQEEAAAAYDMAAIEFRGANAITNFDISNYTEKLKNFEVKQEDVQVTNQETPELVPQTRGGRTIDPQYYEQEEYNQMVQQSVPKLELIESIDSDIEHNPWDDICLDLDLNSLQIPNIPFDKTNEFLGLFDDKGFEDNIDFIFDDSFNENEEVLQDAMSGTTAGSKGFIFDDSFNENEVLQDAMSGTTAGSKGAVKADVLVGRDEKGRDALTTSSPPSTTTSVGSNIW